MMVPFCGANGAHEIVDEPSAKSAGTKELVALATVVGSSTFMTNRTIVLEVFKAMLMSPSG